MPKTRTHRIWEHGLAGLHTLNAATSEVKHLPLLVDNADDRPWHTGSGVLIEQSVQPDFGGGGEVYGHGEGSA
jgi:hypothetical protein